MSEAAGLSDLHPCAGLAPQNMSDPWLSTPKV